MRIYEIAELKVGMTFFGNQMKIQASSYFVNLAENAELFLEGHNPDEIETVPGKRIKNIRDDEIIIEDEQGRHYYYLNKSQIMMHSFYSCIKEQYICELITDQIQIEPKMKDVTPDMLEYIQLGAAFSKMLLNHNGFCLHASAIAYDGQAVLFSAPSQTGKSTQTRLWQEYFGKDRVTLINDDKPAVRRIGDTFYAYGTPWGGSTGLNTNIKVPIKAIVFLKQAKHNRIYRLSIPQSINALVEQGSYKKNESEQIDKYLGHIEKLVAHVPIYYLECTIGLEAVETVWYKIFGGSNEN